jgi:hypothetical protein
MRRELPALSQILEELANKAALQIDRLAPVAFDAALDELTQYHSFLLNVNASRNPDGTPLNYAAVYGESWSPPHNEWIGQYRRLFERAANRIGDDPDFFGKLAHVPLRLLPHPDHPEQPPEVLQAITDLGRILIHQLEAWVTKRTVVETTPGSAANPRMALAGSDAKAYANLLPEVVGAWEILLQTAPTVYRWRDQRDALSSERWDSLRGSWPYLWQHIRNTAYMLAVSVWNEDETGAALLRDVLVRWPQTLGHEFTDHLHRPQRRLLFPDLLSLDLTTAHERITSILPPYMAVLTPDELFGAILQGAHDDVVLLTAALLLLWSMEQKQSSDIGARTAAALLRRELEDSDEEDQGPAQDKPFGALVMDIVRLEIAGDRRPKATYSASLDRLVEALDNMTERRVVPGRVYTPSTLHDRDGLRLALLTILLARAREPDDVLIGRVQELAKNEPALPTGDRSLRDILHGLDRFQKMLESALPGAQRGLALLNPDADFAVGSERVRSIISSIVQAIETERTERLRRKPINPDTIAELRDAVELGMMTSPGGVQFFRGFSIEKVPQRTEVQTFTFRLNGLSKAQFVDPPMGSETVGLSQNFVRHVTQQAGRWAWGQFTQRVRETIDVPLGIEDSRLWDRIKRAAADVGAEPLLIVSRTAEGRLLREFINQRQQPPAPLTIERKRSAEGGNSYIATIEGIDVCAANFEPGKAWLFSPYMLQCIQYAAIMPMPFDPVLSRKTLLKQREVVGGVLTQVVNVSH